MKRVFPCKIIRTSSSSKTYAEEQLPTISDLYSEQVASANVANHSGNDSIKKFRKISANLSPGKVVMSTGNVSETMELNVSLKKRKFLAGRVERLFRKYFPNVNKDEEILLGAHKCSLFTTAGPIKGRIFMTSERIAFHSRKLLKLNTYEGEVAKFPYKVSIPIRKIKNIVPVENLNRSEEKYTQVVTVDEFEFWFMGFVNYQRSFESLHLAIPREQ